MRYSSPFLWLLIFGLVPLGSLCGLEGRVAASCGDYVHILSQKPTEEKPNGAPCPCQGPNCHQQTPDTPMPAPAAPVSQYASSDLILSTALEFEFASGTFALETSSGAHCSGCDDFIFHPPR